MKSKVISTAVTKRLPRYYRYLSDLLSQGIDRISSKELSDRMEVTASQIRQDLNNFGGFGQQGYGYNVEKLYNEIGKILGLDTKRKVIIVGGGHIGQALANYSGFSKRGFELTAIFDSDESLVGTEIGGCKVLNVDEMATYVKENEVKIAILTVPTDVAPSVAESLSDAGIEGIWNFALVDLKVPENVVVENVHLEESLMNLAYNISAKES